MTRSLIFFLIATLIATGAIAQNAQPQLPLPRYVSMRADEGNVRRGPSTSHRIDWVFTQRHTPLRVVAQYEHWRKVVDREGQGGWMHFALLSGTRYVSIESDLLLRRRPDPASEAVAQVERGVIARLLECAPDWCRVRVERSLPCESGLCLRDTARYRGWVPKDAIWGVEPDEIFD